MKKNVLTILPGLALIFILTIVLNPLKGQQSDQDMLFHEPLFTDPLDSLIQTYMDEIDQDSIEYYIQQLQNLETRFMLAPNRKQVALWVQNRFESLGCQITRIDSFQTHTVVPVNNVNYDTITWQYNVSAIMPGIVNPDQIVIIGGHYDCFTTNDPMTVAPGADDNGSAVAAIFELARVFNEMGYQPNKTIHFVALGAEELMYYSSQSGAGDYAERCAQNNDNVLLYVNNDMIANEPENENWIVDVMVHDLEVWTTLLSIDLADEYTSLETNLLDTGPYGADDLPFWEAGFNTVYFMEHNFSPYYHTEGDIVDHCNMEYCSEITMLDLALLLSVSEKPTPVNQFCLNSLEDGETLKASWIVSNETDILEYEVRFGTDPENLNEIVVTSSTNHQFTGLETGTMYYASICAINELGCKSVEVLKKAKPAVVTMDQGILIVAGSEGGLLDPLQEDINLFYDSLCHNYVHDFYDATITEEISLEQIGEYSSILWHIDNYELVSSTIGDYSYVLRNYLYLGGNILITGYRPAFIFGAGSYPASFKAGSFMFDCFHVAHCKNEAARLFAGAINENSAWPSVFVDSIKMPAFNYHLPWVEALTPTDDASVLFRYDTKYDTTSQQGAYYNLPVGITGTGTNNQTVLLSYPLYYMDFEQSNVLIYKIMTGLFGEEYLDVEDKKLKNDKFSVRVYPNPAKDIFHISSESGISSVNMYNVDGQVIHYQDVNKSACIFNVSQFYPGIYFLQIITENGVVLKKIIVE